MIGQGRRKIIDAARRFALSLMRTARHSRRNIKEKLNPLRPQGAPSTFVGRRGAGDYNPGAGGGQAINRRPIETAP